MSLIQRITDLAQRVAVECKALRTLVNGNAADLSALTTTAKGNLVLAVNELKSAIDALVAGGGAAINDATTTTTTTWSSSKIATEIGDEIATALAALTSGAPGALDTLDELAAALGDDANFASTITTALGNRVRVDAAQSLTTPQQVQARSNIGAQSASEIGDPETNYVTTFNAGLI
jgi:hypothetical protein